MEEFGKANVTFAFSVAVLALATAIPVVRISAAPNPPVKSGVDCHLPKRTDRVAGVDPLFMNDSGTPNAVLVMNNCIERSHQ